MDNPRIPNIECDEILKRARKLYNDRRVSKNVPLHKEDAESILRFSGRNGYITRKQKDSLEKIWEIYQKVVKFNQGFRKDLHYYAANLLEEVANFAEPYIKGNKHLTGRKGVVRARAKQIRRGEYFWDSHIKPAFILLENLREMNIKILDLDQKVSKLMKEVSLPY